MAKSRAATRRQPAATCLTEAAAAIRSARTACARIDEKRRSARKKKALQKGQSTRPIKLDSDRWAQASKTKRVGTGRHYIWGLAVLQALPIVSSQCAGSVRPGLTSVAFRPRDLPRHQPSPEADSAGNQSLGQFNPAFNRGQSKPAPGSYFRPGATCSWPATPASG
jgi:hypothetical protein